MDRKFLRGLAVVLALAFVLPGCGGSGSNSNHSVTYTVTYNGNGNTGGSVPVDSTGYRAGDTVTLQGAGDLIKTGHSFAGWNTKADGTGTTYGPEATFAMGTTNVTLYAKWVVDTIPTYTVTYNGNGNTGGNVPVDSAGYRAGDTVTVQGAGSLTKTGYSFAGWNTKADGTGTTYTQGQTFPMEAANVTLYAKWTYGSELIFHSGFEPATAMVAQNSEIVTITGTDNSFTSLNNWAPNLGYAKFGYFKIQYNPGVAGDRYAAIVNDPTTGSGNKVLKFYGRSVQDDYDRLRVQANIYENSGLTEIYYKFRMYLHPDFNKLKTYGETFEWLTLAEFWNQTNWEGLPYPYRVSLNIGKTAGGTVNNLYFTVYGQKASGSSWWDIKEWSQTNVNYPVPIGQWLTCEIWYKQGNANTGRFYYSITPDGGQKQIIFDITDSTYHPDNPAPGGLQFNPFKLYTSKQQANHVRDQGGALQIYWDDIEFRTTRP
jgi:uncharacterized repeat protein (TIGR02543 family)